MLKGGQGLLAEAILFGLQIYSSSQLWKELPENNFIE